MNKTPQNVFKDGLDKAFSGVKLNVGTMKDHALYKQGVTEDDFEGTPMIRRIIKKLLHTKKKDIEEIEGHSNYYHGGKTPGLTTDVLNTILTNIGKKGLDDKEELPKNTYRKSKKKETNQQDEVTEKWSEKYKKSIDCSNPKGFSQKAHCDGRKKKETKEATGSGSSGAYSGPVFGGNNEFWERSRSENPKLEEQRRHRTIKTAKEVKKATNIEGNTFKVGDKAKTYDRKEDITIMALWEKNGRTKAFYMIGNNGHEIDIDGLDKIKEQVEKVEAKEATTTGSSGGYESPSMWAKSTKKKDWGPSRKTQIPGGGFVKIKKKCTKFPYCNQGDINNIKISKNESVKEAIKNVSSKMGVSENVIKTILEYEYEKINKRPK